MCEYTDFRGCTMLFIFCSSVMKKLAEATIVSLYLSESLRCRQQKSHIWLESQRFYSEKKKDSLLLIIPIKYNY